MSEKIFCFIPARGGSKRIPRKNIKQLNGKPLLGYCIEAAQNAGIFGRIVISSDDEEILSLAQQYNCNIDQRPKNVSTDTVRVVQVVDEYLNRTDAQDTFDAIAVMLPTCPFTLSDDITKAYDMFRKERAQDVSLISMTQYSFPPQLSLVFQGDTQRIKKVEPEQYGQTTRSQDIEVRYHPNGAFYMLTIDKFLRDKTFFTEPMVGYAMPPERSFDIDYSYQFSIAEAYMKIINAANQ